MVLEFYPKSTIGQPKLQWSKPIALGIRGGVEKSPLTIYYHFGL